MKMSTHRNQWLFRHLGSSVSLAPPSQEGFGAPSTVMPRAARPPRALVRPAAWPAFASSARFGEG